MSDCDAAYIHVAGTRLGLLRDATLVLILSLRGRVIGHCHNGNLGEIICSGGMLMWYVRFAFGRMERLAISSIRLSPPDRGFRSSALAVVYNCISDDLARIGGVDRPLVMTEGVRVLYMSNLFPSKGCFILLDAARLAKETGANFRFDFCGSFYAEDGVAADELERRFKEKVAMFGLERMVTWHGAVRHDRKVEMLQSCHIMALPSDYRREALPVCLIEALAFGMPIIGTKYRGIPDMLVEGVTGTFVAQSGDSIVAGIHRLTDDVTAYVRMRTQCRRRFLDEFTFGLFQSRLVALLRGARSLGGPISSDAT